MSPIHRESDGLRKAAPTWASLVERLIQEAQERGEFDDLPYRGERLPDWDDDRAGEMRLAFHVLRNAGAAPPWIETDKEVRRLEADRDRVLARAARAHRGSRRIHRLELARILGELDDAIERLNGLAPTPRQQRRRPNIAAELESFDALPEPGASAD